MPQSRDFEDAARHDGTRGVIEELLFMFILLLSESDKTSSKTSLTE